MYEVVMLLCFASAWPFSIYKSWKSRSTKGKSIFFLYVVFCGYIAGILHKLNFAPDRVIWIYGFNAGLVLTDVTLYYRNLWIETKAVRAGRDPVQLPEETAHSTDA